MGSIYQEFERDLAALAHQAAGDPQRELIGLLLMALEREEIVTLAYREEVIARRLASLDLPLPIQELISQALIWAWRDEEMHAIYMRGLIFKLGDRPLQIRAMFKQLAGAIGGWATAVRQHLYWDSAPIAYSLATLLVWLGVITKQIPDDVRVHLTYGSLRNFCRFNVDAERTARRCYERMLEVLAQVPQTTPELLGDVRRIQEDEQRHTQVFELLAAAFDEQNHLLPGVTAEGLAQQLRAVGEYFLPRALRSAAVNPIGSGGTVWCLEGAPNAKRALFRQMLRDCGLLDVVIAAAQRRSVPASELRIAIKTTFMLGYHHKDRSTIIDPELLRELARFFHALGCRDIAVLEAPTLYDHFYANRSVDAVATYFGLHAPEYRIVDVSNEQVSHSYARGVAQYSVSQTWRHADVRISFGKLRSHPVEQAMLAIHNLSGLGARQEEYIFTERQAHHDTAVMMTLEDVPPHFALLEGYDTAPDGILGMLGSPHPKAPHRLYAGADALSVDFVAARHMGIREPHISRMLRSASHWFGDPSGLIKVEGCDQPIRGWRHPQHNQWSTLLSLLAYPMYQFGSGRGALFVAEMDEVAFPPYQRDAWWFRIARRMIQALLGLRYPTA